MHLTRGFLSSRRRYALPWITGKPEHSRIAGAGSRVQQVRQLPHMYMQFQSGATEMDRAFADGIEQDSRARSSWRAVLRAHLAGHAAARLAQGRCGGAQRRLRAAEATPLPAAAAASPRAGPQCPAKTLQATDTVSIYICRLRDSPDSWYAEHRQRCCLPYTLLAML